VNHALEMLAELPGVRHVMLVTEDGVPVAVPGGRSRYSPRDPSASELDIEGEEEGDRSAFGSLSTEDALAALAIGLLGDLSLAVGQMSWNEPTRVVLKAARGTLILQTMRGAVLLVLLARGMGAEETRLAMDGTIARIERSLRGMNEGSTFAQGEREPPGPIPSATPPTEPDLGVAAGDEPGERSLPESRY
jgi:predicted regulator of Ras-like GTPase activity (Roadblock/LC7/MglB family)